jgi:hypothetical protein
MAQVDLETANPAAEVSTRSRASAVKARGSTMIGWQSGERRTG